MNLHIFQRTLFTKLCVPHIGHFAQREGGGKQCAAGIEMSDDYARLARLRIMSGLKQAA